jgi:hypothetical protein
LASGLKLNELLLPQRTVGHRRYHDRAALLTTLAQLDRALVEPAQIGLGLAPSALDEQGRIGEACAESIPERLMPPAHSRRTTKTAEDLTRSSKEISCSINLIRNQETCCCGFICTRDL